MNDAQIDYCLHVMLNSILGPHAASFTWRDDPMEVELDEITFKPIQRAG